MLDPFLEREKELMKLNESLNNKMSFDLKTQKPTNSKSIKAKNCTKEVNKLKNDSVDIKKLFSVAYSTEKCEKPELDSKDSALNRNNNFDDTQKNEIKRKSDDDEFNDVSTENTEKSGDIKSMTNQFSLIPSTMFRKNVSSEGIIKFLKAKVTILQQELDLSHQENTKTLDNLAKAIEQQKKSEAACCQANTTINALNSRIQKLQPNEANILLKLKESESIQQSQRKEFDDLKIKFKNVQQANASLELRLSKSQDDLECVRKNFRALKNSEKDLQLSLQHERTFYENQLKINQKQRSDLIVALKKHILLIENLKRQNSCLAQAKCIQMSEVEFVKILDWNNSNANKY